MVRVQDRTAAKLRMEILFLFGLIFVGCSIQLFYCVQFLAQHIVLNKKLTILQEEEALELRVDELKAIHDAEMKEIEAWYKITRYKSIKHFGKQKRK